MSAIRVYGVRRFSTGPERRVHLCATHVERRKVIGWRFLKDYPSMQPDPTCWDCDQAKQPTALEAQIEAEDAAKAEAEPKAAPVLPGQRRLFE